MQDEIQSKTAQGPQHLVLYDGMCALCNRAVRFLLTIDKHRALVFAPLQGETARRIARWRPEWPDGLDSIVLVRDYNSPEETLLARSDAVLEAVKLVGGAWAALSWLRMVPRGVRDRLYDAVARRRYRWFGKYQSCRMPAPHERRQFLP